MMRKFVEMNFSEKKKNSSLNVRDARSSASLKTEVSWKSNWNWKKKPFSFKITSFVEKTHSTRCDSEELQNNTKCLYSCCDNSSVCLSLSFLNIFSSFSHLRKSFFFNQSIPLLWNMKNQNFQAKNDNLLIIKLFLFLLINRKCFWKQSQMKCATVRRDQSNRNRQKLLNQLKTDSKKV